MTYDLHLQKCDFNAEEMQAFKYAIQVQALADLKKNPQMVVGILGEDRFDPRPLFQHIIKFTAD